MATNIINPFSRRDFLTAGAGIITASLFSPFSIALSKPKECLGVALVGLGYYSTDLPGPAKNQKLLSGGHRYGYTREG